MESQQRPVRSNRSWVEWRAGRIDDPLERLRYLQSVAPRVRPGRRGGRLRVRLPALLLALTTVSFFGVRARVRVEPLPVYTPRIPAPVLRPETFPDVWQVDAAGDFETYSNGLRIDTRYAVATNPRSFRRFPVERPQDASELRHTQPVGIVFHTTESAQEPFEPGHNRALKQVAESLVEFVRRHRAYNYLIDRFGRVFRIVNESDAAQHAGYSVWEDDQWLYVDLNESFLGVSFEARTEPGQEQASISPAQVRAAAVLIEMLRSRYDISVMNCVTHAQVSVNPSNMRIGYHTDWASSFPFGELGLPDNYARPLPALVAFGFEADDTYRRVGGNRLMEGVELAEERVRERAAERGLPVSAYRRVLQRIYRERFHQPVPDSGAAAKILEAAVSGARAPH
ncbi:MAG TPA: peptidoglycan recognition family protein [Bryobacteraceae bacterium]|nr:peptidoglycan recognition family protein [Bryobacteraceae bacterium]